MPAPGSSNAPTHPRTPPAHTYRYLLSKGLSEDDLKVYRCNPDVEPPRLLAVAEEAGSGYMVKRGSVARLEKDKAHAKL